jgi:hypothetical protein
MSLLLGQYGSLSRDDYVQPALNLASGGPNFVAYGSFLQPGPYGSLSIDDRSRFRNTAYTPPLSIELMNGFFNYPFRDSNPNQNNLGTFPRSTYISQQPGAVPRNYSYSTVPALGSGLKDSHGDALSTAPYGQVMDGPVSSSNCPPELGYINVTGACQVPSSSPLYNPTGRNIYY